MTDAPNPSGVTPVIEGKRLSMTRAEALPIATHKDRKLLPDWLLNEADEVLKLGRHWRDV